MISVDSKALIEEHWIVYLTNFYVLYTVYYIPKLNTSNTHVFRVWTLGHRGFFTPSQ